MLPPFGERCVTSQKTAAKYTSSPRAGSRWNTSARSVDASIESSGEAARRDLLVHLAPLHQTPSRRISLFFGARGCDSTLNLLAGYQDGWILAKFVFCAFMDRDGVKVYKHEKSGKPISSLLE